MLVADVETTSYLGLEAQELSAESLMQKIKNRAISRWGSKWVPRLTEEYIKISGTEATIKNRSSQLKLALETGACKLETAILLARAVGCQFKLVCFSVEEL